MSYPDHIYRDIPELRLDPPTDLSEPEDDGEVEYMERLERAAPDLLAALVELLADYESAAPVGWRADVAIAARARVAIAKAGRGDKP